METLSHKNPSQKERVGGVAQGDSTEFKPQYQKKKKYHNELSPHTACNQNGQNKEMITPACCRVYKMALKCVLCVTQRLHS
jgi:hypothetical protein